MENIHHQCCTRDLLRYPITYCRKITGDSNDYEGWQRNFGRKKTKVLQLRRLATKVMITGQIQGMPEVNRQLKGDHLLGEICQLSSSN